MGLMRFTAAAVLVLAAAGARAAECASDVREIFSRNAVPALAAGPAAWNGNVLAVAMEQVSNGAVWMHVYNERSDLLYPYVRIAAAEGAEVLENLWNGDHFGIFYRNDDNDLVLRKFSTTGELIGAPVVPLQGRLRPEDRIDIIWSSRLDAYLVARTSHVPTRLVVLTILNRDGTRRTVTQLETPANESFIRIAETDSGVIGIFYEQDVTRDVMMLAISPGGSDIKRKIWTASQEDPVVTDWNNQFVLVRAIQQGDGRGALRWKVVNTTGFDTIPDRRLVLGSGIGVAPLSLQFVNNELALTYLDAREGFEMQTPSYRLVRWSPVTSDIIADTVFAAAEPQRQRAATDHDFIWTGASYLAVAVRRTLSDGDDTFIIRLCPLNARIQGPTVVETGATVTFAAAPEGGVPGFAYEWRFGEINVTTGPSVQRTHTLPGTYSIELTVIDNSGTSSRETRTYTVVDPPPPPPPPPTPRRRAVRKG